MKKLVTLLFVLALVSSALAQDPVKTQPAAPQTEKVTPAKPAEKGTAKKAAKKATKKTAKKATKAAKKAAKTEKPAQ